MPIKDYYSILETGPSANLQEIKKAYRKLALQYHPDKNNNDPYAVSRFVEIKEAYEVLTHPGRKEIYLQQRWYEQSIGTKKTKQAVTPVTILKQVLELEKYVSKLDVFRMDTQGLHDYIAALLDNDAIEQLNSFKEEDINGQIITVLMNCLKLLPTDLLLHLHQQLTKIDTSIAVKEKFTQFIHHRKRSNQRDQYRIWIILLIVIALCLLIIFSR